MSDILHWELEESLTCCERLENLLQRDISEVSSCMGGTLYEHYIENVSDILEALQKLKRQIDELYSSMTCYANIEF